MMLGGRRMGEVPGYIARSVRVRERKREVIAAARAWGEENLDGGPETALIERRLANAILALEAAERDHG